MATVTITKVSDKQKKKRIIIQNKVYELMDKLELSDNDIKNKVKSYNRQIWEDRFKNMSDIEFHNLMLEMKNRRGYCFSFESNSITDKKNPINVNKLNKIAKELGFKLREYVVFPHKNRANPDNPVISKTPLPVIAITVKRLQQMLTKKNKTSSDNSVVNPVTGQVTNDSKAARLSNAQTYSLMTSEQHSSIKEYLSVRADDEVAKRQMFKEIEQTGRAKLKNYDIKPHNKQSIQAMEVFLRSAGLYSNILKGTPTQIKQSKEDLINGGLAENNRDLDHYKMLILGEIHLDTYGIRAQNRLIERFKPKYLLHESVPPGDIIDPKEARRRLAEKRTTNHLGDEIWDLYVLAAKINCTLVGIDALQSSMQEVNDLLRQFVIRESKMLQHIDQFFALDNIRIAVVVGDTHLRYFKTRELGYPSPIITKYINNDDVLIIRGEEIKREINRLKDYTCHFINAKPQSEELERYDIEIEEDKEKTKIGFLFVKYILDKSENIIKFDNKEAKFIGIKILDEFRLTNSEKAVTKELLETFTNKDYFMLFPRDSEFTKNKNDYTKELFEYDIDLPNKEFVCVKI